MTDYLESSNVVQDVSAAAAAAPGQAALVDGKRTLEYGSLIGQANQLAHYLLARGVKPEDKIGISMCRSINFAVAALGILKAGGAYVALDPSYPAARRRLIEEDAGLVLSLGSSEEGASVQTVSLQDAAILAESTDDANLPQPDPKQLAYVVYTSGSTGVPKGVEVTHGNLMHLVRWHNQAFQVGPADHATLLANVGFDAAVWELWPYLSAGATLFVPELETIRQPEALRDYIVALGITVMFAPTLLGEALIQLPWPSETRLHSLLTGGDALRIPPPPSLPFDLINNYGPAECTVVSTSGKVKPSDYRSGLPSLGFPIEGASIALLDDQLQEVPEGTAGEICIAGAGLARGYLHQPELTAQRFITRDGVRMYRSGDLGSRNADGSIQFLGRADQQVKIRGYRIECGEIEAALNTLLAVDTSAVVVREQRDGHMGLVAYLAPAGDASFSHQELRQSLRMLLPDYMVPEQFIRVSQIPMTENGKIDRSHLPVPDASNMIVDAQRELSPVETELMVILKELLSVEVIAPEDDFFLLGGHSFIAAQLIARVRDWFGVELGLRTVFENPTLAGMAEQIEKKMALIDATDASESLV
ncbi:MAG TPA: non-ribosomal peptide synthetase [Acidobacteriaceae bacterium]